MTESQLSPDVSGSLPAEEPNVAGMDPEELSRSLVSLGLEPFRGRQVFPWIHKRTRFSYSEMTDLSREVRELLERATRIRIPTITDHLMAADGTEKFLFLLEDGHTVEGVLIPEEKRVTLCVSTQVGCAMGCAFCMTGAGGLVRNLTVSEIAGQVLRVRAECTPQESPTHLVFMGMGEPLANYANTLQALRLLLHPLGTHISKRKITLSTCGLIPGIRRLARENMGIRLAVSLNAPDNATRNRIMPVNRKYPMEELLGSLREYPLAKRDRITFEYVLMAGVNDSLRAAETLARVLRPIPCKVNLIPLNPTHNRGFRPPPMETVLRFRQVLLQAGYTAMIRVSRGGDISAACGQLKETQEKGQLSARNERPG